MSGLLFFLIGYFTFLIAFIIIREIKTRRKIYRVSSFDEARRLIDKLEADENNYDGKSFEDAMKGLSGDIATNDKNISPIVDYIDNQLSPEEARQALTKIATDYYDAINKEGEDK